MHTFRIPHKSWIEIPHKGVYRAHFFEIPHKQLMCGVLQFALHSQSLCKEKRAVPIWYMKHAWYQSLWRWLRIPYNDVFIKPNFSHSPQVAIWNSTQVCVRETAYIPHKPHLCVAFALCLNYRGCCMGIYIMECKEFSCLQDDTSSLSTSDAPYLMRISEILIVSLPSTQVTIWDSSQGCDFHAHFPHTPRVVNAP